MRFAICAGIAMLAIFAWTKSGLPVSDWGVVLLLVGASALGFVLDMVADRHLLTAAPERNQGELPGWVMYAFSLVPAVLTALMVEPSSMWVLAAALAGYLAYFAIQMILFHRAERRRD